MLFSKFKKTHHRNKNMFRKFIRNTDATTAVEFALVAAAFFTLLFGIFESGRLFLTWNSLQYSIENATRHALVNPDATEGEIIDFIRSDLKGATINPENVDINVMFTTISDMNFIEIRGAYPFKTVLPFLPEKWNGLRLSAQSRLPIQS